MKYIKFRQKVINEHGIKVFHYWGIMDNGSFIAPIESDNHTYWEALENSEKYTGLKDKNGKEIYEGDIVGFSYIHGHGMFSNGIVRFENGCFWISDIINDDVHPLYNCESLDIKGNIYENPELLGAK